MARMLLARVAQVVPTLILLSMLVFALVAVTPVDPARRALEIGGNPDAVDERDVQAKRIELLLDRPLGERYGRWAVAALQLDLGQSFVSRTPVAELIRARLGPSAVLASVALASTVAISLPLGVFAAARAGGALDLAIRGATLAGASLPSFWLALLAMWLFSVELRWLPALGSYTPRGLVLPALVLTLRSMGLLTRLTRAVVLESLHQDYVRTAEAKGLPRWRVVVVHALPNALPPILTVIGLDFAGLLAHGAIVEWIFAWPGIGRLGVDAVLAGDLPVIVGFALTVSVLVVLVNLIIDVGYLLSDPRQHGIT